MSNEVWEEVLGYQGMYLVSNLGNVKSMSAWKNGGLMKLKPNRYGYYRINLCLDMKRETVFVHRIVWEAFNGVIPDTLQINHIDGNKTNNRLDNLELVTASENIQHAFDNDLMLPKRGEANGFAKLTEDQVREIRKRIESGAISMRALSFEYGISDTTVRLIIKRKLWKHVR